MASVSHQAINVPLRYPHVLGPPYRYLIACMARPGAVFVPESRSRNRAIVHRCRELPVGLCQPGV